MTTKKLFGQFFTPPHVARTLMRWAIRHRGDRILDPSCGDGEFLGYHPCSVGIEIDGVHAANARQRAQASLVHESDFFAWAEQTHERIRGATALGQEWHQLRGDQFGTCRVGASARQLLAAAAGVGERIDDSEL